MSERTITDDNEQTAEETLSASGLTPKEEAFCVAFTDVESDTYGNGTAAAKKAGYSAASAHNAAWKLRRRPKVRARLNELYEEIAGKRSLTPSRVLSDIEDTRRRAITKGDLAVAVRCSELMGKTLAIFRDVAQFVGPEEQRQLDAREQAECAEIARLRLDAIIAQERAELSPVFSLPSQAENEGEKRLEDDRLTPQTAGGLDSNYSPSEL